MAIMQDGRTLMYTTSDTKLIDTNTHAQNQNQGKIKKIKIADINST